jgi:YVTN family beta-propeller protein
VRLKDMRTQLGVVFALGSLSLPGILFAQSTPHDALLVLSKGDQTLSIVDPGNLKVVAQVPVGKDPHEVIASTDGRTAYVSNYGYGAYNTLTVVDLEGQKALAPIDLGPLRGPHGLAFVGGKTWFTAEVAKAIASYDPETKKVDWVLGTGQNRTHMLYVFPDMKRIITTNVNSGTVSIIEKGDGSSTPQGTVRDNWNAVVVPVGKGAEGFDLSPDRREIWVANAQDGTISIIDVATKKVIDTLSANVKGANRLKFTPDGKLVFVSRLGGSDLAIFDTATRKEVKRLPLGHGGAGILMQPDGTRAYVACSPDGYVAVIDLKSLEVIAHINIGKNPDGMAWAVQR